MNLFATTVPGLHPILSREITSLPGAEVNGKAESDGRNDLVRFSARDVSRALGLRTSEDVFAEVSSAHSPRSLWRLCSSLVDEISVNRALSVFAREVRPLVPRMTFRVIARTRSKSLPRTDFRDELTKSIARLRPRWRSADPALLEFWALETRPGLFRLGLRLTSKSMRQRGGRAVERRGALRPSVAAALVLLAGRVEPRARLLDPLCGTGSVLREALAAGWLPVGGDLDPAAVSASRRNIGARSLFVADVRSLPLQHSSVFAVASNLPFGKQYQVQGRPRRWFEATLEELARVLAPGRSISLLETPSAAFEKAVASRSALTLLERFDLRLLGARTSLWLLQHRPR